ncbi:MAG: hypothetical protein VB875_02585, partial [Pirellulales bacterium]
KRKKWNCGRDQLERRTARIGPPVGNAVGSQAAAFGDIFGAGATVIGCASKCVLKVLWKTPASTATLYLPKLDWF